MHASSVSVVIPAYNAARFIGETLESVFAQKRLPGEVIVVDDASTDGTPDVVREAARAAPVPVRVIELGRNSGGPSRPLNVGVEEATGELIATQDHDDRMEPERLELQARCQSLCPDAGLVIGGITDPEVGVDRGGIIRAARRVLDGLPRAPLGERCYRVAAVDAYNALVEHGCYALTCSTFLFPKRIWRWCGGFDDTLTLMCDYGFLQAITARHPLGVVDAPLVRWAAPADSLYASAQGKNLFAEHLRICGRFDPCRLSSQSRRLLRGRVREEFLGRAYDLRCQGCYGGALANYILSAVRGGLSREAVAGIANLLPHRLLRAGWPTRRPGDEQEDDRLIYPESGRGHTLRGGDGCPCGSGMP